jgi:hypothetical protein
MEIIALLQRSLAVAVLFALSACGGGGGSTPAVSSTTPVIYVPNTSTVAASPTTFTDGQSVQFEPQEADYQGTFSITPITGTAGSACITTAPATVANGGVFTSTASSPAGCTSYPQSVQYNIADANGHGTTFTVQMNAP